MLKDMEVVDTRNKFPSFSIQITDEISGHKNRLMTKKNRLAEIKKLSL